MDNPYSNFDFEGILPSSEAFSSQASQQYMYGLRTEMHQPMFLDPTMIPKPAVSNNNNPQAQVPLMIRTNNQRDYRVYLKAEMYMSHPYINGLMRFLDSRNAGETVTFVLGTQVDNAQAHVLGPVISAIQDCKAKVITIAAGYCSIPESFIWCYGHERHMLRYGALSFGKTDFILVCEAYKAYFDICFQRARSLGVLTDEQIKQIWDGNELMIMYPDFIKLPAATNNTDASEVPNNA